MLDNIKDAVKKFLGNSSYDKAVEEFIKDLQKALITSDVKVSLVLSLSNRIKERLAKEKPPSVMERKEWFISIVYEELSKFFGGDKAPNVMPSKLPYTIMMVGVQGSGKTTSTAKLAYFYKKKGYKVGLVAADTYRPAAYDQLVQLGNQIQVPVIGDPSSKDAVAISLKGEEEFLSQKFEVIIIDTAGRHGYGEEGSLLEEMQSIYNAVKPDDVILVIDASIGQKAYDLASKFHSVAPIGSILITKMDGTAKGGGALSAVAATGAQIKFIGTGERVTELEVFDPRRFASRLLGMGDINTIIEKMKEVDNYEDLEKKMEDVIEGKGKLTLRDIYRQFIALRKMGPLSKILQHIPGLGVNLPSPSEDQVKLGEDKIKKFMAAMNSMTYKELDNPSLIDRSRIRRIAEGAGITAEEVRELMKQYEATNKMLKTLKKRKKDLERMFGNVE